MVVVPGECVRLLKVVLPLIERIYLRGAQDFAMIGTYSTNFGNAAEVAAMLRERGLEVEFSRYVFGCATGDAGRKIRPAGAPSTFSKPIES